MGGPAHFLWQGKQALLFYGCVCLFVVHQLLQKGWGIALPWADSHLDNLLCLPILLHGWQWERFYLYKHNRPLQTLEVAVASALVIVFSEVLFPRWSARFTADYLDAAYYALGAGVYLMFRHKPR